MNNYPIILFDGVCNLCNSTVQFVIRHDQKKIFRFASLQGDTGQQLLKQFHLNQDAFSSFVLIYNGTAYTKSTGALKLAKMLGGPISIMYGFIIVPRFVRDWVYNLVSAKRYKWFGKKDKCMIPDKNIADRFLI